jgi:hypothetical protein
MLSALGPAHHCLYSSSSQAAIEEKNPIVKSAREIRRRRINLHVASLDAFFATTGNCQAL